MRQLFPVALIAATFGLTAGSALAANATQKECSTKYQADKAANKLNGMSWNQYYKQCAASAKTETPAAPAAPAPTPAAAPAPAPAPAPAAPVPTTKAKATPSKTKAAPAAAGGGVFPAAIAPEFANEKPGDARRHTCAKQWNAIKGTSAAAGLKWSEKGGGYYSECTKKLKG